MPHRPTHDADLLGFGSTEIPHLENLFRKISQIASDDGILNSRMKPSTASGARARDGMWPDVRPARQFDSGFEDRTADRSLSTAASKCAGASGSPSAKPQPIH
ncbi:MAG: hypothetical protein LBF61_04175 [Azoarcus sp.]|nr:hypothetical protein [Azoarcus sp.]